MRQSFSYKSTTINPHEKEDFVRKIFFLCLVLTTISFIGCGTPGNPSSGTTGTGTGTTTNGGTVSGSGN